MDVDFGKTNITAEDLRGLADTEEAEKILRDQKIPNSGEKLERYFDQVAEHVRRLPREGKRFPWRATESVYKIYITEILLQRTHGTSVAGVYRDFFTRFNEPVDLYRANEQEIKTEIASLGFQNRRTRSLVEAGNMLAENDFSVPRKREKLIKPWRVGKYAANATVLFGFNKPIELVDANVASAGKNILDYPLNEPAHRDKKFRRLMKSLTPSDPRIARSFYFALIDFDFSS